MALFSTIGSIITSNKANKAANKAADASVAVAQENNALAREIYGKNEGYLSPAVQTGNAAGALLNDFYGIQVPQAETPPSASPSGLSWNGGNGLDGIRNLWGAALSRGQAGTPPIAPSTPKPAQPAVSSRNAFANYIANSDYAFQQATGNNEINSGYAGAGTAQSGAAMKALEKYRQDLQSGYRNQWASGVANQQGVGLGAASALAGVGQNYVSTISANNTAAGDARANAALRQQSAFGNALGTYGGILQKLAMSGGGFG